MSDWTNSHDLVYAFVCVSFLADGEVDESEKEAMRGNVKVMLPDMGDDEYHQVEKEVIEGEINYFVKSSSEKKFIPNFLIDQNTKNIDLKNLLKGFKLLTDYLEKSILKPNNLNLPVSRSHFINLLK